MVVAPAPGPSPARPWRTLSVLVIAALVGLAVPVFANHVQSGGGKSVSFDHKTGNEWWVEVIVGGPDATPTGPAIDTLSYVQAMDTNGAWTTLSKQSWGAYAASFHIEPGHQVRFRAVFGDGNIITSCWFTHPAGVEQCPSTTTSTTTTTNSGFNPQFTGFRGNEWWVQANVGTTSHCISKVDVRSNNGAWMPLAKQSWGATAWANSYHFPQGSILQMRATSCTGLVDLSSCRQWVPPANTDASAGPCPGDPPPSQWSARQIDSVPEDFSDSTVGDADRDGRNELYVTSREGILRHTATERSVVDPGSLWIHIAAGDGDNDGRPELYAIGWNPDHAGMRLVRFAYSGTAWGATPLYSSSNFLGPITLGDVDNDGRREVYFGEDEGQNATIHRVFHDGTAWRHERIVDLGDDGMFLGVAHLWVGDADRDGLLELGVSTYGRGYTIVFVVERVAGAWRAITLDGFSDGGAGIVVGDVDGDGRGEVLVSQPFGDLIMYRFINGAWTHTTLPLAESLGDLFLGDGDNDGNAEVYGGGDGRVHQVEIRNGVAHVTALPSIGAEGGDGSYYGPDWVLVGDGDGDRLNQVYADVFRFGDRTDLLFEHTYGQQQPQAFDATFSGVKGNDWWVQASVSGSQPIQNVDARVNCSEEWRSLTKQSYGWAASFHVPSGSKVDFRAISTSGNMDFSGGYIWPSATPTSRC